MNYPVSVFTEETTPSAPPFAATLQWQEDHLILKIPGKEARKLFLNDVSLSLGGIEKNQVILTTSDATPWRIYLSNDAEKGLRHHSHPTGPSLVAQIDALRGVRFKSRWAYKFRFFLKLLSIILVALLTYRVFLFLLGLFMPLSWEKHLGDGSTRDIEKMALKDPIVAQTIQTLGEKVAGPEALRRYEFKFRVIPKAEVNALAYPGGWIYVHTGLIQFAQSPDELTGVLAHEVQHILERHSLRRMVDDFGFSFFITGIMGDHALSAVIAKANTLQFSRGQEKEADVRGMKLLMKAGLPGDGMITFFERMQKSDSPRWMEYLAYLSTHPSDKNRATYLRKTLADARPGAQTPKIAWEEFKKRCAEANPAVSQ